MRLHAKLTTWILAGLVLALGLRPQALVQPAAVPPQERCTFLQLRMDGGWWLQTHRDRPAAYGFGALPHSVSVKEGAFSIDTVYEQVIHAIIESHLGTDVSATFLPMPGDEGRVFGVVGADALVSDLFARAYRERDQGAIQPRRSVARPRVGSTTWVRRQAGVHGRRVVRHARYRPTDDSPVPASGRG